MTVQYGHKLNLTTGRSGLILDLVIEAGNPADSERFLPMLNRHIGFYGDPRPQRGVGSSTAQARGGFGPPFFMRHTRTPPFLTAI